MRPKPYRRVRFYPAILKAFEGASGVEERAPQVEHVGKRCCLYDPFHSSDSRNNVGFLSSPPSLYQASAGR